MSSDEGYDDTDAYFDDEDDLEMEDDDQDSSGSLSDSGFASPYDSGFGGGGAKGKGKMSSAMDVDFKVLSVERLQEVQKREIEHVAGITGIKHAEAAILIRFFGWNKEKLIERYMESPEKCLQAAGIHEGSSQPRLKRVRGFTCEICFNEDSTNETLALSCDHRYCRDCYTQYVTSKIVDEGESRRIQCMGGKCKTIVDEKTVSLLVTLEVLDKYKLLLNRTYVDDNPLLRWCPAPNCDFAIECAVPPRSLDVVVPTVVCGCGHSFCFGCGNDDHRPCCCPVVKQWLQKCADDSETANWIKANTKECGKCHSTIEKNGGCNHMTCKKCKHEFCWVCEGPWSEHGTNWYNCNRFDETKKGTDAQSKSRISLERYLHYYNRFANHEQSIKLEKDLYSRIERKMEEMQQNSELSWIEVQFLSKAVETLSICRTTLKWTYAMAFYLERNSATELFEDNQSDLEQAVEALSELLEKPIEPEKIAELRQETTDKMVYVQKRNQIIMDDTLKGFDEERWRWQIELKL